MTAAAVTGVRSPERELRYALHPGAWLAWLTAASVTSLLTSNPLYLSLALLSVAGVFLAVPPSQKKRMMWPVVAIGLALSLMSIPLNVLTGSAGATELLAIPEWRSPNWFGGVTLGGPVTGEALISATGRALTIATLIVAAAAFNASVDHFRLMRMAPPSLAPFTLVLTVAVIVVPQSVQHARRVMEARRLRGRGGSGLRSLAAVLLPTLAGSLERSVQRAESLETRGFGARHEAGDWRSSLIGLAGVGLCAWGAFAQFYYSGLWPLPLFVWGIALVVLAVVRGGGKHVERLRSDTWSIRDGFVVGGAVLGLILALVLRALGAGAATYLAYPELTAPGFHVAGAIAYALLLSPALALEADKQ